MASSTTTQKLFKFLTSSCVIMSMCAIFAKSPLVRASPARSQYMQRRQEMLAQDQSTSLGSSLVLNAREQIVSDFLVKEKRKLMESSRVNKTVYYPAFSFYESKPLIEQSSIYQVIKKMPKGAALHIHDQSITSLEWIVKNVTYRDNLYMCINSDHFMIFNFFEKPVPSSDCDWKSVKEERAKANDLMEFDESIRKNISFLTTDPLKKFSDISQAWKRFNSYFGQVYHMIFHTPVFEDYYAQALKEFYEDNVQYIELRGQMWGTTDLDGTTHDTEFGLNIYQNVTRDFVKKHPDFLGAKFIMTGLRYANQQTILGQLKTSMDLLKRYPETFIGYDLVGQEDPNNPLLYFLDDLLYPSQHNEKLPYFFHAGETNWQGTIVDDNLADALLLNTTRIGHGYGLAKHPSLAEIIKKRGVAIEVNPISNQLLKLVVDLRNHAMVPFIADDFPIVISSDDPATWEASPLSHDFYMAFMNLCGADSGLGFLKQLALNSFKYSRMSDQERDKALKVWQTKWDAFITESIGFITMGNDIIG